MGEEDHLKPAVQAEGRLELWQIAIKPGKPLAFGAIRRADGSAALLLGLPGNPVSSFVTFLLCVAPVLRALQGAPGGAAGGPAAARRLRLAAARPAARVPARAASTPSGGLDLFPNQSSGVLTSAVWADGLVDNPPGQVIRRGDTVTLPAAGGADRAMKVQVRYFASLREALGRQPRRWTCPPAARWARCATRCWRAAAAMPRCWRAAARCAARWTRP